MMQPSSCYDYFFDGLYQDRLYGWAASQAEPERRLVIELTVAGEVLACGIANHYRQPPSPMPDPCHGFSIDVSALRKLGYRHISLHIANTGICIASEIDIQKDDPTGKEPAMSQHLVFHDGGLRLIGWYQRQESTTTLNNVHAYLGDQRLCTATANELLPAIRHFHDQPTGFQLNLPYQLADGNIHNIRVVDDQGSPLNGSPLSVCVAKHARVLASQCNSLTLNNLIEHYDALFPKSVHMSYYDEWFNEYAQYPCKQSETINVNVLIYGNLTQSTASKQSVDAQVNAACRIVIHDGFQFTDWEDIRSQLNVDAPLLILRSGDTLHPHAAANLANEQKKGFLLVYADSDIPQLYPGFKSARYPWMKQDWDHWYALATDYQLEPMMISSALLNSINTETCSTVAMLQWQACVTAVAHSESSIKHLSQVLYHLQYPINEQEQASRLAAASGARQQISPSSTLNLLPDNRPSQHSWPRRVSHQSAHLGKVSLIIPTRDQLGLLKRCIDSIRAFTPPDNLEIIIVNNNSNKEETLAYFAEVQKEGVRVLDYPGIFNFSRINNFAVAQATGDVIGFINNDIEVLHEGWLSTMLGWLSQPGIAAVGAKLLWPNEMVQHGGIVMGVGMAASHYGMDRHKDDSGYFYRNQLSHQVSGVTAACLLIRRAEFIDLGGFNESMFPVAFNDVDLCLRLRQLQKKIIWCAEAILLHAESASRGKEDSQPKQQRSRYELQNLREKWNLELENDVFYNKSLNLESQSATFSGLKL